jgi:hypothetical protein
VNNGNSIDSNNHNNSNNSNSNKRPVEVTNLHLMNSLRKKRRAMTNSPAQKYSSEDSFDESGDEEGGDNFEGTSSQSSVDTPTSSMWNPQQNGMSPSLLLLAIN